MHQLIVQTCPRCLTTHNGFLCPFCVCKPLECPRCGQQSDTAEPCRTCQAREREPQGEAVRLFTPAPNQIPGQLSF